MPGLLGIFKLPLIRLSGKDSGASCCGCCASAACMHLTLSSAADYAIRMVSSSGTISDFLGVKDTEGAGTTADEGVGAAAKFKSVHGICTSGAGSVRLPKLHALLREC